MYYAYPAVYYDEADQIKVELPDLAMAPFYVPQALRAQLFDIVWDKTAQYVQSMLANGEVPPVGTKLEALPLCSEEEDKDAFLVELIG